MVEPVRTCRNRSGTFADGERRQIFPTHAFFGRTALPETSALAKLKKQRQRGRLTLGEVTNGAA